MSFHSPQVLDNSGPETIQIYDAAENTACVQPRVTTCRDTAGDSELARVGMSSTDGGDIWHRDSQ